MRRRLVEAVLALGVVATHPLEALAQDTGACAAFKWPVAREQQVLAAADLPTRSSGEAYPGLGKGVLVTLSPQAAVSYTVKPARPPKNDPAYGAELTLADAGAGGTMAVTASEDAWIDLVQNGKVVKSSGFSGKAGCPGVRKVVRFTVAPGPLAIAVSNAPTPTIKLDVVPIP